MDVFTAHFSQVCGSPDIAGGLLPGLIQQIGQALIGDHFMARHGQGRQLVGPRVGAAIGHQDGPVPMQHAGRLPQRRHAPEPGF